jgi:antitoxin (DNA-binding transcriptional repressor) of toxin-antitoxin stability system
LPVGSVPSVAPGGGAASARVIVDRCKDRAIAAAVLAVCRGMGATVLDAGLAATGDRLAVAGALAAAGLPRPETRLVCAAGAALAALDELGYPGTLLPLLPGTPAIALLDRDGAEAVVEHREVLGASRDAIALVQAGAPGLADRATVLVVEGRAVAVMGGDGVRLPGTAFVLAEETAAVLGAVVAGVEVAVTVGGVVVWDVRPVPDYRDALPLAGESPAAAIAGAAVARLGLDAGIGAEPPGTPLTVGNRRHRATSRQEVGDGVALSA